MARIRQARHCRARRRDGEPCRAWAMIGATVCRMHGGSSPRARRAARFRITEADIRRAFQRSWDRYQREWRAWQAKRVAEAATLLDVPVSDLVGPNGVNEALIAWCRIEHGRPDPLESAPKMRPDMRYKANWPGAVG
jgi:hypothetical protein